MLVQFGEILKNWLNSKRRALCLGAGTDGSLTPVVPVMLSSVSYTDGIPTTELFLYRLALGVSMC